MIRKRHPLNVVGPFYVEDGCCTACMLAPAEAPDLLAMTEPDAPDYPHCYFKRQPANRAEVEQVLRAIMVAEFRCFRYAGDDSYIIERLRQMGESAQSDVWETAHMKEVQA
jgi:hypothetical protein